ncbi:MAG: alpha/beta fold hydrolase [Burkholderiaceae bacterium]|nr:alpha/beta fold hydrolase [Burkholderiaceae bacterium]
MHTGAELIDELDARATRFKSACGPQANMVWRRWGTGRPVVLLHGGAGSWMHWVRNIEPLARTRTVWVPDMPGFGDSDLPREGLDADSIAPMVFDGLHALLKGAHFDLVAFSFGSLVAALIAAAAPPGLDRLVLVGGSGNGLLKGPPQLKSLRGVTDPQQRAEVLRFNLNAMMLHHPESIDALALAVQERSALREKVRGRTQVMTDMMLRVAPQWRCAAYGVWGREDFAYRDNFERLVEVVAGLGLRETVFMEDAGHWLQYERSEAFNALLLHFLESV